MHRKKVIVTEYWRQLRPLVILSFTFRNQLKILICRWIIIMTLSVLKHNIPRSSTLSKYCSTTREKSLAEINFDKNRSREELSRSTEIEGMIGTRAESRVARTRLWAFKRARGHLKMSGIR